MTGLARARRLGIPLAAAVIATPAMAQVSPGPLARAHRDLEGNTHCLECHASKKEGMDSKCLACHREIAALRDEGRGLHAREDAPCASCHPDHAGEEFALVEWPGGVEAFDHARAGWALQGKHSTVKCQECHQPKHRVGAAARLAKGKDASRSWIGLEPACASCHSDPHRGALGSDCTRCHGLQTWKETPGFDHGETTFPLVGKHVSVACAKCHQPEGRATPVYKPLPHAECSSCHADAHAGRLGPKCASCHVATSFREVAKTAFDHDRTRWPLAGAHSSVACAKCHDAKTAWGAKPPFATCGGCHEEPHGGQATLAGARVDCTACHSTAAFRPGVLAAAKHAPQRFPLTGKHAAVACAKCHKRDDSPKGRARLGKAAIEIRPASDRCLTCHVDAHGGQLATRPGSGECAPCHSVDGWKPSLFSAKQHETLALPLDGAHAKLACAACHRLDRKGLAPLAATNAGSARLLLVGIERDCASCHTDPHRFTPARRCTDCHDSRSFAPVHYGPSEHDGTAFPLAGAHRAVACFDCHKELKAPRAASSLIRSGAAARSLALRIPDQRCVDCHADPHGGQFAVEPSKACDRCHDSSSFRPAARFDHDRDAALRLGPAHAPLACARCHPSRPGTGSSSPLIAWRGVSSKCETCHGKKTIEGGGPR